MVALFIIAVAAGTLFMTCVAPEIRIALKGRKGFGGLGELSRGTKVVGGIHVNGRPLV